MDWDKRWKEIHQKREKHFGVEFWNKRADNFRKNGKMGIYEKNFLKLANIPEGASVFDMGCGSGTLAIPLAEAGHEVYAGDFSPVMLEALEKEVKKKGMEDRIHLFHMNWNEDWSSFDIPVCDVAISSRSMIVENLSEAIKKLSSKAKKQVHISSGTAVSTHINTRLADAIGFKDIPKGGYALIVHALLDMGIMPRVEYIQSDRKDRFGSMEECFETISTRYFPRELSESEIALLKKYNDEHLIEHKDSDGNVFFEYDELWPVRWAFISWDKAEQFPEDVREKWMKEL